MDVQLPLAPPDVVADVLEDVVKFPLVPVLALASVPEVVIMGVQIRVKAVLDVDLDVQIHVLDAAVAVQAVALAVGLDVQLDALVAAVDVQMVVPVAAVVVVAHALAVVAVVQMVVLVAAVVVRALLQEAPLEEVLTGHI